MKTRTEVYHSAVILLREKKLPITTRVPLMCEISLRNKTECYLRDRYEGFDSRKHVEHHLERNTSRELKCFEETA